MGERVHTLNYRLKPHFSWFLPYSSFLVAKYHKSITCSSPSLRTADVSPRETSLRRNVWLYGHARYHIWRFYRVSWKPLSNTFSWALWCKHCLKWIEVSIFFVDFYDVSPSCFTIWICALRFASPLLHCSGIGRSWQSFRQCYRPKRRWAKQLFYEHSRQICKSWSYKTSRRRANRGENNFAEPFSNTFMM